MAVVVVFALGRTTAPGEQVDVEIQARYGDPSLGAGEEALIVIAAGLLETVVERSLADAPGAVEFDDVVAELTADGLEVRADAGVRVLGVPVRAGISTVALPVANGEGGVGVVLSETRAVGARLPGSVENAIEETLNDEITRATRPEGYRVERVELAGDELLVYLSVDEDALIAGTSPLASD